MTSNEEMSDEIRSKSLTARVTPTTFERFDLFRRGTWLGSKADAIEALFQVLDDCCDLYTFGRVIYKCRFGDGDSRIVLRDFFGGDNLCDTSQECDTKTMVNDEHQV